MDYIYIDKAADIGQHLTKALHDHAGPIGIDIETASEIPNGAFNPHTGWISTIQIKGRDDYPTLIVDAQEIGLSYLGPVVQLIEDEGRLKVAHNAKFEMKWFIHHLDADPKSFFDTMLASQIIAAGDVTARHSLEDAAETFAGIELDKTEQKSDWGVRPLSDSQIEYARRDAEVVLDIYPKQVERLIADDLLRVAVIDFDAIKPIAKTELNGMHLDRSMWNAVLEVKKAELARLHDELSEMLSIGIDWTDRNPAKIGTRPKKPEKPVNPLRSKASRGVVISKDEKERLQSDYERAMKNFEFEMNRWVPEFEYWSGLPDEVPGVLNPRSVPQMQKVLKNVTGIRFDSTRSDFLVPFADDYPVIAKLIEHRAMAKLVSSYGDNFIESMDPAGRVRTNFKQILDTGRMSSSDVNLQQVPHDLEYRNAFTAPAGRKIIIADYSQIELRVLAEFGGDKTFVGDFISGVDLHTKGASRFMSVPVDGVTKEMRNEAKRTNFGVVYGIGDEKLGRQLGINTKKAAKLKSAYFRTYPGNDVWLQLANRGARHHLFARTMSGRIQRFHHDGSRGQISAIGRNGQNMPIQGTSADMMKRALYLLDEELTHRGLAASAWIINIVHDEIVLEVDEADAELVAQITKEAMEAAGREYIVRVPVIAEVQIGDSWGEKGGGPKPEQIEEDMGLKG